MRIQQSIVYLFLVFISSLGTAQNRSPSDSLIEVAQQAKINRDSKTALEAFKKAIILLKKNQQWDKYFECHYEIGRVYQGDALSDSAKLIGYQMIRESQEILGQHNRSKAKAHLLLGIVKYEKSELDSALLELQNGINTLKLSEKSLETDFGPLYNLTGLIHKDMAAHRLAIEYLEKALEISRKHNGEYHSSTANNYNNLGLTYYRLGNPDLAINFLNKAKKIRISILGENSLHVGSSYNNLAMVYGHQKKLDSSLLMYKVALKIYDKSLPANHPYKAFPINNIGTAFYKLGKYDSSIVYYNRAIELNMSNGNSDSHSMINGYRGLGDNYSMLGEFTNAGENYDKAFRAIAPSFRKSNSASYPSLNLAKKPKYLVYLLAAHAQMLKEQYNSTNELIYLKESIKAYSAFSKAFGDLRKTFSYEMDKIQLASNFPIYYEEAISVAQLLFKLTGDGDYLNLAANFISAGKSNLLFDSFSIQMANRLKDIPESLIQEEITLRNARIDIIGKLSSDTQNQSSELFEINRKYDSLTKVLEETVPTYYQLKFNATRRTVQEIQKNLSEESMLLDFYAGDSLVFISFISKDTSGITSVDAKLLQNQTDVLRKSIDYSNYLSNPDSTYQNFLYSSLSLYKLLLDDMIATRTEISKLIIIPHGMISHIPFDILTTKSVPAKGSHFSNIPYLIKQFQIQYAHSLEQIVSDQSSKTNSSYLGIAPIYDDELNSTELGPLRFNVDEVKQVREIFNGEIFDGNTASETRFKSMAKDFDILHLAMHASVDFDSPTMSKLLFDQSLDSLNDGALYIYELMKMQITPELVVLSACQTEEGKNYKSEGVMSLAYAFSYAGSKSLLASQWQIDDEMSRVLIIDFYKNLANGMTKSEAMREAKLNFLAENGNYFAHPSFWAGFVLYGEDRNVSPESTRKTFLLIVALSAFLLLSFLVLKKKSIF